MTDVFIKTPQEPIESMKSRNRRNAFFVMRGNSTAL